MSWQAIDFQRIILLDQSLVEQLDFYFQEKESELGNEILSSFPTGKEGMKPPLLEPSKLLRLKLVDAVDGFSKRIRSAMHKDNDLLTFSVLEQTVKTIDEGFLNYIEILEGSIRELFSELDHIGLENWSDNLLNSIANFRDLFFHTIDDALLAINRLETILKEFRKAIRVHEKSVFSKLIDSLQSVVDPSIKTGLQKLEVFLKSKYRKFSQSLIDYLGIEDKVLITCKKLANYEVLDRLEDGHKEKFKKIYFYTKLGQLNASPKPAFFQDIMRALSRSVSVEYALEIFDDYIDALYGAHYHQARVLKKDKVRYLTEEGGLDKINEVMRSYHSEILSLGSTVARYRDLMLKTDPNPYIRSKWGFTEGIVAPEPKQAKELLEFEFEVENLKQMNDHLLQSIIKAKEAPLSQKKITIDPTIHKLLYEMGQPLTTEGMIQSRAEKLLKHLAYIDELGSTNFYTIEYTGDLLSRMLRADWKFHVLQEMPEFDEIMRHHIGICTGLVDDRKHLNRMNKFIYITNEIAEWVSKKETRKHDREIEFDMNDLKIYLQDFLAQVQRMGQETGESLTQKIYELSHMLLIYRHLFGEFFKHIRSTSEGRHLRMKLLFVDQYFESAEQTLFEIKNQLKQQ